MHLRHYSILKDKSCRMGYKNGISAILWQEHVSLILKSYLVSQDWFGGMGFLQFLRQVGKYARVNVMLSRESVKQRLDREEGISFTE